MAGDLVLLDFAVGPLDNHHAVVATVTDRVSIEVQARARTLHHDLPVRVHRNVTSLETAGSPAQDVDSIGHPAADLVLAGYHTGNSVCNPDTRARVAAHGVLSDDHLGTPGNVDPDARPID